MTTVSIQFLHASGISRTRWDDCVARHGGLIYNQSWVLDALAEDWYGFVLNDYAGVMAIPVKKRYALSMVYMPPFVQRLGPVGEWNAQNAEVELKKAARLIDYAWAFPVPADAKGARRTNYIRSLDCPYDQIAAAYTEACRKNLRKAVARGCAWTDEVTVQDVISFYRAAYGSVSGYTVEHFSRLELMLSAAAARGACRPGGVRSANGSLVYAGLLLDDGRRLYYILGAPSAEGRAMRATYFFIDQVMARFAGRRKTFDFEGSDIPEVATFYRSFAPQVEYYSRFHVNRLPFPFNRLLASRLNW